MPKHYVNKCPCGCGSWDVWTSHPEQSALPLHLRGYDNWREAIDFALRRAVSDVDTK